MKKSSKSHAVVFPFDLFGSAGTAAGAQLIADALGELIADNKQETIPTRANAYQKKLRLTEFTFETLEHYQDWRAEARRVIQRIWKNGEFLFWITGNHLGALPIYDELSRNNAETVVIQFDAHLDIYHLSDCTKELSHGNFLLHCDGPLPKIINVGHRELVLPQAHIERYYHRAIPAERVAIDIDGVADELRGVAESAENILLDLDCDVFDAAYFPGLAHPQPFGLMPAVFLRLLDAVWSNRVCGLAISEFDSARDQHDRSLQTLMWLVEYLLLRRHE